MKRTLPFLLLAIAGLLSAQPVTPQPSTTAVNKVATAGATQNDVTAAVNFAAASPVTVKAGGSLSLLGSLSGTPTGGTLSLVNLSLTLPATFVTTTGTQTLSNKTFVAPVLGAATGTSVLVDTNTSFTAHTATAAKVQAQTTWGGVLSGFGTTNDVSLFNKSGGLALSVPTGTTNVTVAGNLTVGGDITRSGANNLVLNGGSSGASLTLGQGVNGVASFGAAVGGLRGLVIGPASSSENFPLRINYSANATATADFTNTNVGTSAAAGHTLVTDAGSGVLRMHSAAHSVWPSTLLLATSGASSGPLSFNTAAAQPIDFYTQSTMKARLTSSGNLLIGGTTDITGSGGLKVFGTTASTSTTTGALQVVGGVGVGGALNVGGNVAVSGTSVNTFSGPTRFHGAGGDKVYFRRDVTGTWIANDVWFEQQDAASALVAYSKISGFLTDNTAGATTSTLSFHNRVGGTLSTALTLSGVNAIAHGSLTSTNSVGGIGYATGAGGTVTQATSKSTAVTLNKVTGTITLNAAALAASTTVSFTLTSSAIAATDIVPIQHVSGGTGGAYTVTAFPAAGSATIHVRNVTAGSLSEAIVLRFAVIKSVDN